MQKLKYYFQLTRLHKPIGILLLLYPTLWALFISANGFPALKNLFIFIVGVILMRSAGCIINDFADRKFDLHVARTKDRPLTSGKISAHESLILFFTLCLLAFILVLFTNKLTILLSIFAVLIAAIYPFMKRYTHLPQLVLGIAFSFSIPMAFAAQINHIPFIAILLMLANILWTIAYDTQYAMVDREDDIKIGIKSTAILFGKYSQLMIGLLQSSFIILLCVIGLIEKYFFVYFVFVFIAAIFFIYQGKLIVKNKCFKAFLNNQWVGLIIFVGIFLCAHASA